MGRSLQYSNTPILQYSITPFTLCPPSTAIRWRSSSSTSPGLATVLRNLVPQQLAVALAQPVHGGFHGAFAEGQLLRQLLVGLRGAVPDQARIQRREQFSLAVLLVFRPEPVGHGFEQRQGPAPLEVLFGRHAVGGLPDCSGFPPCRTGAGAGARRRRVSGRGPCPTHWRGSGSWRTAGRCGSGLSRGQRWPPNRAPGTGRRTPGSGPPRRAARSCAGAHKRRGDTNRSGRASPVRRRAPAVSPPPAVSTTDQCVVTKTGERGIGSPAGVGSDSLTSARA